MCNSRDSRNHPVRWIGGKQSGHWKERRNGNFPRENSYDEGLPHIYMFFGDPPQYPILFELILADGQHAQAYLDDTITRQVDGLRAWRLDEEGEHLISYYEVAAWSRVTPWTRWLQKRKKLGKR